MIVYYTLTFVKSSLNISSEPVDLICANSQLWSAILPEQYNLDLLHCQFGRNFSHATQCFKLFQIDSHHVIGGAFFNRIDQLFKTQPDIVPIGCL